MRPRLVLVAHGTRHADGPPAVRSLVRRVARRLPHVEVVESYVELNEPSFASVMAAAEGPSVVVPLLLSTGYHVERDVPESARGSRFPVAVAPPLGPHPLLAEAAAMQLRAAGAERGEAVVLVVAGSKDPRAAADARVAGRLLQARWNAPVRVAFLSGAGPALPEVMALLRSEGHTRVAASPYLLAPGYFASKAADLARVHGATTVADVLLQQHPTVAELVVRRYVAAATRASVGWTVSSDAAGAA
jgi:sirohydrochlorin ferrochelatase